MDFDGQRPKSLGFLRRSVIPEDREISKSGEANPDDGLPFSLFLLLNFKPTQMVLLVDSGQRELVTVLRRLKDILQADQTRKALRVAEAVERGGDTSAVI